MGKTGSGPTKVWELLWRIYWS